MLTTPPMFFLSFVYILKVYLYIIYNNLVYFF